MILETISSASDVEADGVGISSEVKNIDFKNKIEMSLRKMRMKGGEAIYCILMGGSSEIGESISRSRRKKRLPSFFFFFSGLSNFKNLFILKAHVTKLVISSPETSCLTFFTDPYTKVYPSCICNSNTVSSSPPP